MEHVNEELFFLDIMKEFKFVLSPVLVFPDKPDSRPQSPRSRNCRQELPEPGAAGSAGSTSIAAFKMKLRNASRGGVLRGLVLGGGGLDLAYPHP